MTVMPQQVTPVYVPSGKTAEIHGASGWGGVTATLSPAISRGQKRPAQRQSRFMPDTLSHPSPGSNIEPDSKQGSVLWAALPGANSYPGGGHNGGNGGSGGGGGKYNSDEGEPGIGSTGGDGCDASTIVHQNGGGGGGGGGASGDATTVHGADGVASDISGTSTYYGGGGGGAGYLNDWGNGGLGGGGKGGAMVSQQPPTAGEDGTGGGGGAGWTYADSLGMAGGSGIVIVRYPTGTFVSATGGTITIDGSDTIHTFTASGSFVCEVLTAGLPPIALSAQALGSVVLDDGVVDSVVIASSGAGSVAQSAAVVS